MPTPEGWAAWTPNGRYRYGSDITGQFWHSINLCRFEPGELNKWGPGLRMDPDEKLIYRDDDTSGGHSAAMLTKLHGSAPR